MPCPACGAKMIRWATGTVLLSNPPQYPWAWRCGCGHNEAGGVERGRTDAEVFRDAWKQAQGDSESTNG